MLFERYAPFVANALADDGSRFERLMDGVAGIIVREQRRGIVRLRGHKDTVHEF
jgi:hypothetical protein